MAILAIDTTDNHQVRVGLNGKVKRAAAGPETPQAVIGLIVGLLLESKLGLKDVRQIQVARGPGSFTGLRVGIAIANALGFALGVPVNGLKISPTKFIQPRY